MTAKTAFRTILTETYRLHGWDIPEYVLAYKTEILYDRMSRPNWQPQPSYAECFLSVKTTRQALDLANTCWFTRAVFPELGQRHISSDYYTDLGQSCYDRVIQSSAVASPTLAAMRDHFDFLAETAYTAIRHFGDFRSMWD